MTDKTTVVNSGGGTGAVAIVAIVVVLLLVLIAFFWFVGGARIVFPSRIDIQVNPPANQQVPQPRPTLLPPTPKPSARASLLSPPTLQWPGEIVA